MPRPDRSEGEASAPSPILCMVPRAGSGTGSGANPGASPGAGETMGEDTGAAAEVIPIHHAPPAEPAPRPRPDRATDRATARAAERAARLARLRAGLPASPEASPEVIPEISPEISPRAATPEAMPETIPESPPVPAPVAAGPAPAGDAAGWRAEEIVAEPEPVAAGFAEAGFGFRLAPIPAPAFLAEARPAPDAEMGASAAETRAHAVIAGLDRLPGAGPGLVWALRAAGIPDLASVAALDPATLAARLGPIGRLVPAAAWIAAARAACEDPA